MGCGKGREEIGRGIPGSIPLLNASLEATKCVVLSVTLAAYVPPFACIHLFSCSREMDFGGVDESLMSPARAMVRPLRTPIFVGGMILG